MLGEAGPWGYFLMAADGFWNCSLGSEAQLGQRLLAEVCGQPVSPGVLGTAQALSPAPHLSPGLVWCLSSLAPPSPILGSAGALCEESCLPQSWHRWVLLLCLICTSPSQFSWEVVSRNEEMELLFFAAKIKGSPREESPDVVSIPALERRAQMWCPSPPLLAVMELDRPWDWGHLSRDCTELFFRHGLLNPKCP